MFSYKSRSDRIIEPLTHLTCSNCNTENSRPFKEGDYVFKEVDEKCPKCGSVKMLITGIYIEMRQEKERQE
ncbi:MAG: hypothetical protein NZ929_06385 [Aigarchaeota archaeon]|nr:hypothetical protein [Aigarchaeota archaeon]MCX8192433.1 hypothetical protein [Nitrososphaeria archaeon]MDW7986639.1 hypothetical protein [Nitrososphaerota archaeon]